MYETYFISHSCSVSLKAHLMLIDDIIQDGGMLSLGRETYSE